MTPFVYQRPGRRECSCCKFHDLHLSQSGSFSFWGLKQGWIHIDPAQLSQTSAQLKEALDSLQYAHMGEANFFDELEFGVLRECGDSFGHSEHSAYDVVR